MPVCKKCGYQNREENKYCVNCGAEIQPTEAEVEVKKAKVEAEKRQKALFVFFWFIIFAVIDFAVAYNFPAILLAGLLMDMIICIFIWISWVGK